MEIYLKIGAALFGCVGFGWGVYYWLNENLLKPVAKFSVQLAESMKSIEAITKDYQILANLKANDDGTYEPLIQKLNDNQVLLQRIADVQEAKFELDHQAHFECDSSGFLIKANDKFCELLKLGKSDIVSYQWLQVVNEYQQQPFIDKWERFVKTGIDFTETVPLKNGHQLTICARKKPSNTKDARLILGTIKIAA